MTARTAPDSRVFGPYRGGVFLPTPIQGTPTDPGWCPCGWHRVEAPHNVCPCCREGARQNTVQEAAGGRQTRPHPSPQVRTPGATR